MAVQTNEDVAAKVRGLAAEQRVNQAQVALALTLSPMAVSRRFSGQTPFEPEELIRLSALLGVSVSQFFGEPVGVAS